jgi:hypothetical protein
VWRICACPERGGDLPPEDGCREVLASAGPLLYENAIMTTHRTAAIRPTGFAGETARALRSALLLLGLIGDRRAR